VIELSNCGRKVLGLTALKLSRPEKVLFSTEEGRKKAIGDLISAKEEEYPIKGKRTVKMLKGKNMVRHQSVRGRVDYREVLRRKCRCRGGEEEEKQ